MLADLRAAAKTLWKILHVVFATAQLLAALITIGGLSIVATIVAGVLGQWAWIQPVGSFALGVLVTMTAFLVEYSRRSTPVGWLVRGYRWVSADFHYTFDPHVVTRSSQRSSIEVEAIRDGINFFENRYQWTGAGTDSPPVVLGGGARILGSVARRRGWSYYYVDLGKLLRIGQRATVRILQEFDDSEREMQPFLAKTIVEPIDRLSLRVTFAPDRAPVSVNRVVQTGPPPASRTVTSDTAAVDPGEPDVRWEIPQPAFGYRYALEWDWPVDASLQI